MHKNIKKGENYDKRTRKKAHDRGYSGMYRQTNSGLYVCQIRDTGYT
jgi:hypothetical protein